MKIVELKNPFDFHIHGNLSRTPFRQLRRKVGVFSVIAHVAEGPDAPSGTVRDCRGKCWDWWMNEEGDVVTVEAK